MYNSNSTLPFSLPILIQTQLYTSNTELILTRARKVQRKNETREDHIQKSTSLKISRKREREREREREKERKKSKKTIPLKILRTEEKYTCEVSTAIVNKFLFKFRFSKHVKKILPASKDSNSNQKLKKKKKKKKRRKTREACITEVRNYAFDATKR